MSTELAFFMLTGVTMVFCLGAFYLGRYWLVAFTAVCLLLSNIVGPKIVTIFGYTITAGTPIFAALPLATDLLTERYGKAVARTAVMMAFFAMMFFVAISFFVLSMASFEFTKDAGEAVDFVFSASLRLMIASPVAYLIWQFIDIWIYHAIKSATGEKMLWLRNNVSTFTAQAGSTYTFFFLGFYGTGEPWVQIATVSILFYWCIALIDTVIVYASKGIEPRDIPATPDRPIED